MRLYEYVYFSRKHGCIGSGIFLAKSEAHARGLATQKLQEQRGITDAQFVISEMTDAELREIRAAIDFVLTR